MNPEKSPKINENPLPSDNTACDTQERTLSLLQKIQAGTMDAKSIRPVERRMIVGYMMTDGYSTADIAQILKVSDRSIERDKKTIREENAIAPDPKFPGQMAGRLVFEAELSIQRIRKTTRDKDATASAKIDAEHRCFQIINEMIASLQRLGYLPIATPRLQADITHSIGQVPELSQIELEFQRLKLISGENQGTNPQLMERLNLLQTKIVKAGLVNELQEVSTLITGKEDQNEPEQ